jgi:hypothetical protein
MTKIWKVIPDTLATLHGLFPVSRVEAIPPGQHLESPIKNELTCVICTLTNGDRRYYGTEAARIGSDLRMHLIVNPRNEVLMSWESSGDFEVE